MLAALISCGGSSAEWAGSWKQPTGIPPGTWIECTLGGDSSITGSGVSHREAGAAVNFAVSGSPGAGVTLSYDGGTTEHFSFAQPDHDHLTWANVDRTVELVRQ